MAKVKPQPVNAGSPPKLQRGSLIRAPAGSWAVGANAPPLHRAHVDAGPAALPPLATRRSLRPGRGFPGDPSTAFPCRPGVRSLASGLIQIAPMGLPGLPRVMQFAYPAGGGRETAMICRECGARNPGGSMRSFLRRVAGRFRANARPRWRRAKSADDRVAPSLTQLVAMVEPDPEITIFG